MSNQKELKLQQDCYKWFWNSFPEKRTILWRVENERRRNRYEQMIAKSTGLVAGVADLNMIYNGQFHAIELKTPKGTQSATQRNWQVAVEAEGGQYHIVRSLDEFQQLIRGILS